MCADSRKAAVLDSRSQLALALALANWSTIDGVNYARTDTPSLFRVWDFILLPLAFLGVGVSVGNVGMVLFVPGAATYLYLAAACAMRAVARSRRAFAVDRAIGLEAWRINQQRLTFH